jgi:hypothetical protein
MPSKVYMKKHTAWWSAPIPNLFQCHCNGTHRNFSCKAQLHHKCFSLRWHIGSFPVTSKRIVISRASIAAVIKARKIYEQEDIDCRQYWIRKEQLKWKSDPTKTSTTHTKQQKSSGTKASKLIFEEKYRT